MIASLVEVRQRSVGRFVSFEGVAFGDVIAILLGQVVGRLALLACGDGSGEVRPFLDGEHSVLPLSRYWAACCTASSWAWVGAAIMA